MRNLLPFLIICGLSFFAAVSVTAQDAQSDEQPLLPEIDPQDIEIRSQFQARFPGLRRQPILGFNPRPRVFQIDEDRRPFIEDEETVMANLPIGELDRPEAPVYQQLGYADPKNGFARVGIGSYFTPEADVYAMAQVGSGNWVSGNIHHTSTSGHFEDFTSSSRNLDASFNLFNAISERSRVISGFGVTSDFNHYPGLVTENGSPTDHSSRVERFGFRAGTDLSVSRTSISGFNMKIDGFANRFEKTSDLDNYDGIANDWGAKGSMEYSRLGNNVEEVHRFRLDVSGGGIEMFDSQMNGWTIGTLSAHYERLFNYQTDVKASLGLTGVHNAENDFTFYPSPDIRLTHTLFRGVDIKAGFSGEASHASLGSIHAENRFIDFSEPIRHQFEWKGNAGIEMEPFVGTRVGGGVSYHQIQNHLYYTQNQNDISGTNLTEQFYQPAFEDANIFRIYGSFAQDLRPDVLWIKADGHWQRPRLSGGEKIPFTESFTVKGTVAFRPVSQLVLEGWAEYADSRQDSFGESLSSFILVGSRFEVSISERMGVYGKLLNLFDEQYELWNGYPERGFQGFVGITYLF